MQFESPIAQALYPVLCAACRDKDSLRFEERRNGHTLWLNTVTSLGDYRILIGAKGRTIHAIQRLVKRAGDRSQCDARFSLENDHRELRMRVHPFVYSDRFDAATLIKRLTGMCEAIDLNCSRARVAEDEYKKLWVTIPVEDNEEASAVCDLSELFFVYGYTLGRKIEMKPEL